MYKGWPWVNMDDIFKNVSNSAKPKLEIVTGKSSKAEANIAGITPAVFIFKGRCDDSPPHFVSNLSLGIIN